MGSKPSLRVIIQKRIDYVGLMVQCGGGPGAPTHAQLLTDCMQGVLHAVRETKALTPEACIEITGLTEATLTPGMVTTVMTALDSKVI